MILLFYSSSYYYYYLLLCILVLDEVLLTSQIVRPLSPRLKKRFQFSHVIKSRSAKHENKTDARFKMCPTGQYVYDFVQSVCICVMKRPGGQMQRCYSRKSTSDQTAAVSLTWKDQEQKRCCQIGSFGLVKYCKIVRYAFVLACFFKAFNRNQHCNLATLKK